MKYWLYMETHIAEELDFNQMADSAYWSVGYFRSVFKDVTGLTPTEYLNRLRILKSLEYMQKENLNVSEAASESGITIPHISAGCLLCLHSTRSVLLSCWPYYAIFPLFQTACLHHT